MATMLQKAEQVEAGRKHFLDYAKYVWPEGLVSAHHKFISKIFDEVIHGEEKRVIINMPPRVSKSMYGSWLLPANYIGHHPNRKVIQATHTGDFSVEWGGKVRDLIDGEKFKDIFPDVALKPDRKAAGHWSTTKGGDYYAVGVGGAIMGRGADLLIIDDPHTDQDVILGPYKPGIFKKAYEWYHMVRQRLQPGGRIIVIMTRHAVNDLTGMILRSNKADEWKVIEFPAIFDSGKHIFPEFWTLKEWQDLKEDMPVSKWNAVYQQNPTSEDAAIIKRTWWKPWERDRKPEDVDCSFKIQSWDLPYKKTDTSDFAACTTWGVVTVEDEATGKPIPGVVLLDAFNERLAFPEMKMKAKELYKKWQPDNLIIEEKASGTALISELRLAGIPVSEYTPTRGNDKISRVNAVSDLFKSGWIYFLHSKNTEEVVEQFASFNPDVQGQHDDLVDSSTQALLRFRQGGFIRSSLDEDYEDDYQPKRRKYY